MENLRGTLLRLSVFLSVCLLGTVALWAVFADLRFDEGHTYFARFVNVSNMKKDSHVRIAGVEVGQVKNVSINRDSTVTVEFTADSSVVLTEGSRAVIRYDNVVGDRFLALEEGAGGTKKLNAGDTIPVDRTQPALDLDAEGRDVGDLDGVVLAREDRVGEVEADLLGVDVERGDELDVAHVVLAELDVHQAGNAGVLIGVLVVLNTLHERGRAVAHADDRDPDVIACGHDGFSLSLLHCLFSVFAAEMWGYSPRSVRRGPAPTSPPRSTR